MSQAKTKPTSASVDDYLAARASQAQLTDCKALMAMLARITGHAPRMWAPSIVGFGSYSYKYDSGRTGESCLTGFAIRGNELVVYLVAEGPDQQALLAKLGTHRMGKACLYFKRWADLDAKVLENLISASVAEIERRYPPAGGASQVGHDKQVIR